MPKHTVANPLSLVTHRTQARYGWHPDLPDARDHFYSAPLAKALPSAVDLRPNCPPVYDQGQRGSCTANAIAAAAAKRGNQPEPGPRWRLPRRQRFSGHQHGSSILDSFTLNIAD